MYPGVQRAFEKQLRTSRLHVARLQPTLDLKHFCAESYLASGFRLEVFAFVFRAGMYLV